MEIPNLVEAEGTSTLGILWKGNGHHHEMAAMGVGPVINCQKVPSEGPYSDGGCCFQMGALSLKSNMMLLVLFCSTS